MSRREGKVPDEALVAERRARYAGHWPRDAAHRSSAPGALQNEPEFVAFEQERQAIFAAQARVRAQIGELEQRNELAKAEHGQAARRAMETDAPLPPAPELETSPLPAGLSSPQFWDEKHKSVEAAEKALLVDRADHWKSRLNVAEAEDRVTAAREALDAAETNLKPLTYAVEAIDRLLQPIRAAEERRARTEANRMNDIPFQGMRSPRSPEARQLVNDLAEAHGKKPSGPLAGRR